MTQNREGCWLRLESVIRWSNMSINHFARHIGLSRGENLYQIKRGNNGISRKLAEMVESTFPEVNALWLMTGKGEMLKEETTQSSHIDFYDEDAEASIRIIETLDPDSKLMLPRSVVADFAMVYRGVAMAPSIPTNSVVILQGVTPDMLIPGSEYLVVTRNIVTLRIVRLLTPESPDGMLRLAAIQSGQYDDIFIEKSQIDRLYKVVAKLVINN